jgi:hypothetical protein
MTRRLLPGIALSMVLLSAAPAFAQQSVTEVLSFLLTNRSIPTGDFLGDAAAAAAARDAITGLLRSELATVPVSSPATGFVYRVDPSLGSSVRASESFGPFFTERPMTAGRRQLAFGFSYNRAAFNNIDGRELGAGTLVATASRLVGEAALFDAETLTLKLRTSSVTFSGQYGLTDDMDLLALVPIVTVRLDGERLDTYYGSSVVQATGVARATGLGDVVIRIKRNVRQLTGGGLAFAVDAKLATGDADSLLGGGSSVVTPRMLAAFEQDRLSLHGNFGYAMGGRSNEIDYRGALAVVASPRLTLVTEVLGRRLGAGRLTNVVAPHPQLAGIETIRLSATEQTTTRTMLVVGARWNVAHQWLVSAQVLRPLTSAGLNVRWVPTVSLDYSMGR